MRTPPLRRRLTLVVVAAMAALLLALDLVVYAAVSARLADSLDELLSTRLDIATSLAQSLSPPAAADQLTELGIPAELEYNGQVFDSEPLTPRLGAVPPARPDDSPTWVTMSRTLDDGTTVTAYANRAGVDGTLRDLAIIMAAASVAVLLAGHLALRVLVDRAMRPLGQVAGTAERIAAEGPGERLDPDRPDTELGRMAVAFDDMLDALEDTIAQEQAEKERTRRFLADAAHQLRTPMTGIRGAAELLLQADDPELRDRLLGIVVRETSRSARLVSSLLRIARLDLGQPAKAESTDIVELCRGEVERTRELAPQLLVRFDEPSVAVAAPVEPDGIAEALANVLDNARRHARSAVHVRIETGDGSCAIVVRDDGPGVPVEARELIFERFATLDGQGGSGLGLSIARAVAESHGGSLVYADDAFVLRVPAG